MHNYSDLQHHSTVTAIVSHEASRLCFRVCAKIVNLIGNKVEPQQQDGEKGSFVYYEDRPNETYVIYILNKIMFEFLAKSYNKEMKGLHIHECVNTTGDIICWPEKVSSEEEAIEVLKKWSEMIGALLTSPDIGDINEFYEKYKGEDGDWGEKAIIQSGIQVEIE